MLRGPLHACLLLSVLLPAVAEAPEPATTSLYLGTRYPLEVSLSFHSALLHWMDSLAGLRGHGMTAGKTIEAHREQYQQTLGAPRPDDVAMLERFSRAASRPPGETSVSTGTR